MHATRSPTSTKLNGTPENFPIQSCHPNPGSIPALFSLLFLEGFGCQKLMHRAVVLSVWKLYKRAALC